MSFSKIIKSAFHRTGKFQKQLEYSTGLPKSTLSDYKNGNTKPDANHAVLIANNFDDYKTREAIANALLGTIKSLDGKRFDIDDALRTLAFERKVNAKADHDLKRYQIFTNCADSERDNKEYEQLHQYEIDKCMNIIFKLTTFIAMCNFNDDDIESVILDAQKKLIKDDFMSK